ncbi:hypothetical protein SISSUDRAFT_1049476 [Sistotremastrum suecicum HHB10207 ss-3]|uniref:Uncharacterized protein n=1 Tax=Sistotremastrum suecicum HHB10207 ss-3 TaxID=1314776 RepID=A0A166BTQ1_9AGAM|nr:hypothetical protein SISSUDRAFT_1049476 [Sistotremastrum suecicum HHB10207 ss-3]
MALSSPCPSGSSLSVFHILSMHVDAWTAKRTKASLKNKISSSICSRHSGFDAIHILAVYLQLETLAWHSPINDGDMFNPLASCWTSKKGTGTAISLGAGHKGEISVVCSDFASLISGCQLSTD